MRTKKILIAVFATLSIATVSIAQTIPSYVPTSGLIGWWPFNSNANDESGNGNNGVVNGATLTSNRNGKNSSAYSFNGINNNIVIENSSTFNINQHTISAWVKIVNGDNYHHIINKVKENFYESFNLQINQNSLATWFATGSEESHQLKSSIVLNKNQWVNVLMKYNGSKVIFYLNGIQIDSYNRTGTLRLNTNQICIGSSGSASHFFFNGSIDDVAIWNRALTDLEIELLYKECNLSFTTQPSNQSVRSSENAIFNALASSQSATYQWQTNPANFGWQNIPTNITYSGVKTSSLTVKNIQLSNHNQPFRVIVTDGNCIDTSNVALINVIDTCLVSVSDTLIINAKLSGLTPPNNSTNIKMYPNPAKDYLIVDLDNYTSMSGYTIVISNSLGQSVSSTPVSKKSTNISLSILGIKGIYLVQIKDTQSKPIVTKKLLIK